MDTCPPLEDIAAFLDGMLSPEERERVTEHLARCESCYEIFAGAVHFEVESSAEDTDGRGVLPFPLRSEKDRGPRRSSEDASPEDEIMNLQHVSQPILPLSSGPKQGWRISWWLPLAASVVLATGIGFLAWRDLPTSEIDIAALSRALEGRPGVNEHLYRGDSYRGEGEEQDFLGDKFSFLAGVHLLDLRLSVRAGDWERTRSLVQDLGLAVRELIGLRELGESYLTDYKQMEKPSDLERLAPRLAAKEAELDKQLAEYDSFQFGKWAEAGRLSALTESREFFDGRKNHRFLSSLLKNPPSEGDESLASVPGELRAIEEIWARGDFSKQDYNALAASFGRIIKTYEHASTDLDDLSLPGDE